MMFGPKTLQSKDDQGKATSFLTTSLVTGLVSGALASQLLVYLL